MRSVVLLDNPGERALVLRCWSHHAGYVTQEKIALQKRQFLSILSDVGMAELLPASHVGYDGVNERIVEHNSLVCADTRRCFHRDGECRHSPRFLSAAQESNYICRLWRVLPNIGIERMPR